MALAIDSRTREGARWPQRAVIGAALLAGTWTALGYPQIQRGDVRLGDAVRSRGSEAADRLIAATTELGSLYGALGAALSLALSGRRAAAKDVLGVGVLAWAVAQHSKTRVGRARPYESELVRRLVRPPTGSSFPSGHAALAAATMTVLADRTRGRRGAGLLHLAYLYVAMSRVYVGVHYPTDVLGGVGLGMLLGSLWRGPVGRSGRRTVDLAFVSHRRVGHSVRRGLRQAVRRVGPPLRRPDAGGAPRLLGPVGGSVSAAGADGSDAGRVHPGAAAGT